MICSIPTAQLHEDREGMPSEPKLLDGIAEDRVLLDIGSITSVAHHSVLGLHQHHHHHHDNIGPIIMAVKEIRAS
jgi:hypothetical protein